MKLLFLIVALIGIVQAQPTWTSYIGGAYTQPPYFTSWNRPVYDSVSGSGCTLFYVNDQGTSIYSNSLWCWKSSAHTMTKIGTSGTTGMNGESCLTVPVDPDVWPLDRHPLGQMVVDTRRNVMWIFGGPDQTCPPGQDLYKLSLNLDPTANAWTHLADPAHYPTGNIELSCAYDPDDDVIFCYGNTNSSVYCPTDLNPTPGTLTALQTAAGCSFADDFTNLTTSGTAPTNDFTPGLVYDTTHNKIVVLGGIVGGPDRAMALELSVYDVPTKTWTPQSPTGTPPVQNQRETAYYGMSWDFNPNDGKLYYFRPSDGTMSDNGIYTWTYGDAAWTVVCTDCTGLDADMLEPGYNTISLTIDHAENRLILWTNADPTANFNAGEILEGQLTNLFAPLTITEKDSNTTTNYPIQIGRIFELGVIDDFPQAFIDGSAVATQADVKQRWGDGSVKHAIISFLIPTLTADSTITISFSNQAGCNCGSFTRLTKAQMLDAGLDFDAHIIQTNGITADTSARTMLNADAFTYWLEGSINTCVIIADDSLARAYDVGSDADESFRPRFNACFWPTIDLVQVRIIGEVSDVIVLQDQDYDLELTTGNAAPATVLTQANITHTAKSRWSRSYWIGGTPTPIEINHNFAYLISSKVLFNYDQTKAPTVTAQLSDWAMSPHDDLYSAGFYEKNMPLPAGRQELSPYPRWVVLWAYTQDYRSWDIMTRQAELAAAWPVHWREGTSTRNGATRYFDQAHAQPALGLPVMMAGRPTMTMNNPTGGSTEAYDEVTYVGTVTDGGFIPDQSHGFDAWTVPYLLSGDHFFYEEMLFWHSFNSMNDYGPSSVGYGRGPTGAEGVLSPVQVRAIGWALRTRAHLAYLVTPDGPLKNEFLQDIVDAFSAQEGGHNITAGLYAGNAVWNWQDSMPERYRDASDNPSPLGFIIWGDPTYTDGINLSVAANGTAGSWQENYILVAIGRTIELGFTGGQAFLSFIGTRLVNEITNPAYNIYQGSAYHSPGKDLSGNFFTTWAAELSGFTVPNQTDWLNGDCGDCYKYTMLAGSAFITGLSGGSTAQSLLSGLILGNSVLDTDPSFAIIPRGAVAIPGSTIFGPLTFFGAPTIH